MHTHTRTRRFNPLEQIIIASPVPGGNYTISVLAFNLVTPQNYALVISGQFSGFAYNETAGEFGPVRSEGEREGGREGGCVCVCACVSKAFLSFSGVSYSPFTPSLTL